MNKFIIAVLALAGNSAEVGHEQVVQDARRGSTEPFFSNRAIWVGVTSFPMVCVLGLLLLTGCQTSGSNLPLKTTAILEAELARTHRHYTASTGSKVMAACMNWKRLDDGIPHAVFKNYYYVGESSDADVSIAEMLPLALLRCEKIKEERGARCDCVPYALNDSVVVRVPE